MINKESRSAIRVKKHMRVRNRLAGTTEQQLTLVRLLLREHLRRVSRLLSMIEAVSYTTVRFRHQQMQREKLVWNSSKEEEQRMKREIIDASKLELEDKVVAIKRVTKVVKGGRNLSLIHI